MNKKIFLIFVIFSNINLFATDYDDDAAKVDFYVPGILANDALSQVNFLLCFQANTNFGTFANAGPYKVLIDEAACQTADGADAAAELQAATGGSSEVATDSAVAAVEEVVYSPGIMNITSDADGKLNGVGWFDIIIDMDDNVTVDSTAYVQTVLRQDVGAGRPYGNFTLLYEIKTNEAVTVSGRPIQPGTAILKGYLDVEGTTLKYYEDGPNFTPRGIVGVLGTNKRNGYLLTNIQKFSGNPPNTTVDWYQARYKLFQDLTAKVYCQKFDRAIKYTFDQNTGVLSPSSTTYENATAFNNEIQAAFDNPPTAFLSLEGGTKATVKNENCWSTDIAEATRVVYEYGTYLETTGARYDLPSTSLSLEANSTDNPGANLTQNIYAHASYHGTHVRDSDQAKINSNLIFKNQRDSSDTAVYSLTKNYYQVWKKTSATKALNQLDGIGFQWYVGGLKTHPTWSSKIGASGFSWPLTGNCNAAQGNCPEYSGYITVNGANNVVTFTATHGMNWNTSPPIKPFELNTPLTFTSTQWVAAMTDGSGWNESMYFHNPDSREQYRLPYAAFSNTTAANVKITAENKVDIASLNGKTFICVERCLAKDNLNNAIADAFTKVDAGADPAVLGHTPYNFTGPFFKVASYYDGGTVNEDQDGNEPTEGAGRYNNIGGVVNAELSSYTVSNGVLVGSVNDGGNIEWTPANASKLDQRKYRDGIRRYQYKTKYPTFTVDNWTRQFGHSFRMTAIDQTDKASIKCSTVGGNARGYTNKYRAQTTAGGFSTDDSLLVTGDVYYCGQKIREGVVDSYVFELLKRPDYKILKDGQAVTISPPKSYEYAVPASGITYNFPGTNLAGKKFTLKFEGFGNLHNFPGKVFNTCTGDVVGRYVDSWDDCYRYVPEFTLPDNAILEDKTGNENIRVRALRGDEFLKQFATNNLPGNRTYADGLVLPTASDLVTVSSIIGTKPTTGILNGGKASVIHGETVAAPSP